jgi:hypothetical protein
MIKVFEFLVLILCLGVATLTVCGCVVWATRSENKNKPNEKTTKSTRTSRNNETDH